MRTGQVRPPTGITLNSLHPASVDNSILPLPLALPLSRLPIPGMMQSPNSQEPHETEPERPVPPVIIGSTSIGTNIGTHDDHLQPLQTPNPMNEETLGSQPLDSIVMQTGGSFAEPSEQASLGQQQVRYHKAIARHESGSQRLDSRST